MEKYRAGVDEKERKPDQEQVLWEDKADNEEKGEGGVSKVTNESILNDL